MRRLSILDLARGHQPMSVAGGRFSIVFNGEIYNHLEIRRDLAAEGVSFATHCDTETILAGYAQWGDRIWPRLEGMFAVAIWDAPRRELTLARDPLGIKPLYLSEQAGGLAFASELKALTVLPEHAFDVDDRAVHDFFSFGHVRTPRSIYRQVRTLPPGHVLKLGAQGEARMSAFWRPQLRSAPARSEAEWVAEMQEVLLGSVARHMLSDVPVAAFLSGGVDSSAVLAAMRRSTNAPLKAFTVGYPGARIDETDTARRIAQHLGCEHVVLPLEFGAARDVLPQVQRCFDEPFADMAAIPTWLASKLAAEQVKVVLCGEGGDELFAGYKRHRNAANIERLRPLIAALGPLGALVERTPALPGARLNYLRQHAQRAVEFVRLPDGYQQFFAATQISRRRLRGEVFADAFAERHEGAGAYERLEQEYFADAGAGGLSALEQFLVADLTVNMPSAMLTRLDRASMAHSLEARVPMLSHRFVDWALGVPTSLKMRGNVGKYLLRRAVADWLPPDILKLPKQGFQVPMAQWLRGEFGIFARDVWAGGGAADSGYLDRAAVDRLFDEHRQGQADHSRMLYAITVFGLWWRESRVSSDGARGVAAEPSFV